MIMERFHAVERVNQILFEMGGGGHITDPIYLRTKIYVAKFFDFWRRAEFKNFENFYF